MNENLISRSFGNNWLVQVSPDEMSKHLELFGGDGAVHSEKSENIVTVLQRQENMMDKPKIQRPDNESVADLKYRFVQEFNQKNFLLRFEDRLYMVDNGIYRLYNEETFVNKIFCCVCTYGVELTRKNICWIVDELKMRANTYYGQPNDERYTYCLNGYFNNYTGSMEFFSPADYFPTIKLAGAYLGFASQVHPFMDSFLSTLFDGNAILIQRAWEIIGYCISSDAHAKRFFVFPGASGDNGKSTFIDLICKLLTGPATIGMSMKNLLSGHFAISELQSKRINVSSDEGFLTLDTAQLAVLKSLSGHDMITADKKNTSQVSFLATCKIIIASNHDIGTAYSNGDSAVIRRICTLPFDVKIPRYEQNPNIVQEILNSELNEITTEALNAFIRLKNNDYHFTGDDTGIDDYTFRFTPTNAQYREIEHFVQCCLRSEPGNFILTKDLYDTFQRFHNSNCSTFKDITGFSQALYKYLSANSYAVKKVKRHHGNGYEGINIFES